MTGPTDLPAVSSSSNWLRRLSIGSKLTIGFGLLVALTLFVAGIGYLGSKQATISIDRTEQLRVPTALTSTRAQADLFRMLGDVRGYLALGESRFRDSYEASRAAFESDLAELETLAPNFLPEDQERLHEMRRAFSAWAALPETLFELRDNQIEREPAYRLLSTEGLRLSAVVLIDTQRMIEEQAQMEPTLQSVETLRDMADFQASFTAMLSGLRGYITTRNSTFQQEYRFNLDANQLAWDRLEQDRERLSSAQQELLDRIAANRADFLELPPDMFATLESDRWREDLYIFQTQAVPLADEMRLHLANMTASQQGLLKTELNAGREELDRARMQTLAGGLLALLAGLIMAVIFRANIAGPIRRLTDVAARIRGGDLEAQARVESHDETGALAETFNSMTAKLSETLQQARLQKRRADDLLDLVIPIGVELTTETDFNQLLEAMLVQAKTFCNADAGTLYLRTADDMLAPMILRNDVMNIAMGGAGGVEMTLKALPLFQPGSGEPNHDALAAHVAHTGQCVAVPDVDQETDLAIAGPRALDLAATYEPTTYLTLPLKNSRGEVRGVMQLLDAHDPNSGAIIPFDRELQRMMASFSSLAVAALEAYIRERSLKQEIRQLRIEIDEVRRQQQVEEIVETDFFQDLQSRAKAMRERQRGRASRRQRST